MVVAFSKAFLVALTEPICSFLKLSRGLMNFSWAWTRIPSISSSMAERNLANCLRELAMRISSSVREVPRQSNWQLLRVSARAFLALMSSLAESRTSVMPAIRA